MCACEHARLTVRMGGFSLGRVRCPLGRCAESVFHLLLYCCVCVWGGGVILCVYAGVVSCVSQAKMSGSTLETSWPGPVPSTPQTSTGQSTVAMQATLRRCESAKGVLRLHVEPQGVLFTKLQLGLGTYT